MYGKKTASYEAANRKKTANLGDAEKHGVATMNMSGGNGEYRICQLYRSYAERSKQKTIYPLYENHIDSQAIRNVPYKKDEASRIKRTVRVAPFSAAQANAPGLCGEGIKDDALDAERLILHELMLP